MIEIRTLNKQQLEAFIRSESFSLQPFLPISRHRAQSQIKNPRAGENDILLLLAYENGELLGYLGALPDYLFYNGNSYETCAWLSCMWIDEKHRGKKIAQQLLEKCFEVWQHKILVTEFTEAAKRLYDKTGVFDDFQVKKGIRLYIRSDLQTLLPPKKPIFEKLKGVLKVFDATVNLIFDLRFFLIKREKSNIEILKTVDTETEEFIRVRQQGQVFRRGAHDLNWILENPWILAGEEDESSRKYHFSSLDRSFDFYAMKLRDKDNRMIAFLIFTKRHKNLKLPYAYMDADQVQDVANLVEQQVVKWRINTFTCFHPELVTCLEKNDTIALFRKPVKRHYIISKVLKARLADPGRSVIQDGDADAAFT